MSSVKQGARKASDIKVKVVRLAHGLDVAVPAYQSALSAGMDLQAAVPSDQPLVLKPGERALIPTGLSIAIQPGFEGQVRPRSGLALKHGVTVLNSPGTIDADYRGEVGVVLINLGDKDFSVARFERIAQLIIAPVTQVKLKEMKALSKTARGDGGFGSTGVSGKAKKKKAGKKKKKK